MSTDENTENRIIEAAKQVFLEKGFDGARMQEIADIAKINKAMLNYYFRSKDKLFHRIFEETVRNNIPYISAVLDENMSFEEIIKAFVDVYISILQRNPFAPMFILHEIGRNPEIVKKIAENLIKPKFAVIFKAMQISIDAGDLKNVDQRSVFIDIMSLCVYPFIAKPIIQPLLGFSDEEYAQMIEERKRSVPEAIMNSLRKGADGSE